MNLYKFDLNLLKVLDALLAEHSTVRAGQRIGLSQSAVSAALGRLRKMLGDPLFLRQGQRIVPTDYAISLEAPLRNILEQVETVISGPDTFDPARARQKFKISGTDFFAELLMPPLAEILALRAPGIQVQLVDLVPDNYVRVLDQSDIDLALMPSTERPDWIGMRPVFHSSFVLVAKKGHPRLVAEGIRPGDTVPLDLFCDLGHVLFSPEGKLSTMGDAALAQMGRRRRVVMSMPVFSGICSAVAQSDRVALMPHQIAVHHAPRLGLDLFRPPISVPKVEICMLWHKRATSNPSQRWLRDIVAEVLVPLQSVPLTGHPAP